MRYNPFSHYDKYGCLKPPVGLYLCLVFLLRGYMMWVVALSFRQDSARLLGLFYPDKASFFMALLVGIPAVITAGLVSLRRVGMPRWFEQGWSYVPGLMIISALTQLTALLTLMPTFHRLTPLTSIALFAAELIGLVAIVIYSLINRHLKDVSKEFPQDR